MRQSSFMISVLCLLLACCAWAQDDEKPANLFQALETQDVPTMMLAKELTDEWQLVRLTQSSNISSFYSMMSMMSGVDLGIFNSYFTRGDTFEFGAHQYLIVYSLRLGAGSEQDEAVRNYLKAQFGSSYMSEDEEDPTPRLWKDAQLVLSLVSSQDQYDLQHVAPFDPVRDLTDNLELPRSAKRSQADSRSNLKQISLAMMMYTQDYDEVMPPMIAARTKQEIQKQSVNGRVPVQSLLMPYTNSIEFFLNPATQRPYLPNYKISRLPLSKIDRPSETLLFFEDAPLSGFRNVAYADGHVKRISEEEFQRQRKAQGISETGLPSALPVNKKSPGAKNS